MNDLPDYVHNNRAHWDQWAPDWVEMGERGWNGVPSWGIWGVPESVVDLLPADMSGMDAIELGCGTGYVSAWMIRRGARVVGIDNSERQLETARRLAAEHSAELELIHGNAETVPYPDESFDFAISEYGAAIWADPYKWVPEAHRLLRPGGELSFLGNHPMIMCVQPRDQDIPATRSLHEPYFGMYRVDWDTEDDTTTVFNLPISEWMRLFDTTGFDVVAFYELQAPEPDPDDTRFFVSAEWAHRWPSEQAWRLRKR
jgi:SAM-dependent methyltransferase